MISDIRKEKWDLLIILDACRLDTFQKVNWIEGELDILKTGSSTVDYFRKFFSEGAIVSGQLLVKQLDIVYISANPWINMQFEKTFKVVRTVWDYGWDYVNFTVHPATMSSETFRTVEKYPKGRIISHWLQPHHPFIGEFQLGIPDAPSNCPHGGAGGNVWREFQRGKISKEDFIKAYESNLEFALKYVEPIVRELSKKKKIIITSDHGNVFGEYGLYGHPNGYDYPELTEVPWLVIR